MKKINKNIVLKIGIILVIFISGILGFSLVSYSEEKKDVFQDCIDKEFKKVNKKAKNELEKWRENKNECFDNGGKKLGECIDRIEEKFGPAGEFATGKNGYYEACKKALECTIKKQEQKRIGVNKSQIVMNMENNKGYCARLADVHLAIYKSTGYEILNKNKYDVEKKFWDKLTVRERKMYGDVMKNFENFNNNLAKVVDSNVINDSKAHWSQ